MTNTEQTQLELELGIDEINEVQKQEEIAKKLKDHKIFFDSDTYIDEDDYDYIYEDLCYLLSEYVNKARGHVVNWILLSKRNSHYGSICNNGAKGYGSMRGRDLAKALLSINADRLVLKDNEGLLQATFYDHDGTNVCEVKSVTMSKESKFNQVMRLGSHEKIMSFVENLPSMKTNKRLQG